MLKFTYFNILCSCHYNIELQDSDFLSPPKTSRSRISLSESKTTSIKCPSCGKEGKLKIQWNHMHFPGYAYGVLYRNDVRIDEDFHITECKINVLRHSPFSPSNLHIQTFINDSLTKIYNEFFLESQKKNFRLNGRCVLNFNFIPDSLDEIDYSRRDVQQLYLLCYFYAYFLQYKHLYSQIELDLYNIFSVGCGSLLDYYGFRYAKNNDVSYNYYGIDQYYWYYRDLISNSNVESYNKSLSQCISDFKQDGFNNNLGKFNVFVFPKSIEYLENDENGIHELSQLAKAISKTEFEHDKIYVILNGMDNDIEDDEKKLGLIIEAFTSKDYTLKEPITSYNGEGKGLNVVCGDSDLHYPENIKNLLSLICDCCANKDSCPNYGNLKKIPMLKANYFKYRIAELVKEKS